VAQTLNMHLFVRGVRGFPALCQVIGGFDYGLWKPSSWGGGLRPAVSGECVISEAQKSARLQALYELTVKDLGYTFADRYRNSILALTSIRQEPDATYYSLLIDKDDISSMRLPATSGGLRILHENRLRPIENLEDWSPELLVPCNVDAMTTKDRHGLQNGWALTTRG